MEGPGARSIKRDKHRHRMNTIETQGYRAMYTGEARERFIERECGVSRVAGEEKPKQKRGERKREGKSERGRVCERDSLP